MFKFKGISSKEMDVCVTEINNLIRKAPQRYEEIYIDGRDGAFFHPLGYSPIEVPLELTLMKPERIDEVLQWLNGTGWLEYNGRKTKAHIFSEVEPIRASTVRIIQVTIIRNPFWEKVEDDWEKAWGANLIKNGWDDFVRQGTGKNLIENWNFSNDDDVVFHEYYFENKIVEGVLRAYQKRKEANNHKIFEIQFGNIPKGDYFYRIKMKAYSDSAIERHAGTNQTNVKVTGDGEWHVYEVPIKVVGDDVIIRIWNYNNTKNGDLLYEVEWVQLTPADNQHLVVDREKLDSGLTKVRTWGGDRTQKLGYQVRVFEKDEKHVLGAKIKNTGKNRIRFTNNLVVSDWLYPNQEKLLFIKSEGNGRTVIIFYVDSLINENISFVAYDPFIIEGEKVPFWNEVSDPVVLNEGTVTSNPLIKLERGKDRQCEFEINGTYFKFHFNDDDHVILDCEEMEATYNGFNRNRHLTIGFEWPKLKPKENFVKRISGDAKISFKRKDRWL